MDLVSGSDLGTQNWLIRSSLGDAANSLTLDEIAALRRKCSSDGAASTVSLDLEQASSLTMILASAPTSDTVFRFADPVPVSGVDPDRHLDIPNPIDRLVQWEKDRKLRISAFSHPMAKFHAMD